MSSSTLSLSFSLSFVHILFEPQLSSFLTWNCCSSFEFKQLMAIGRVGRGLVSPLLAVNFVVYLIILGLAGWSLDKYINGEQNHPHLGGNTSTSFLLVFALSSGAIGVCSVMAGLMHLRAWRRDSLAAASSLAILSWSLTAIAVGFVCKEIILGGHRGKRLQTLEAFVVISLLSQLLYLGLLFGGMFH